MACVAVTSYLRGRVGERAEESGLQNLWLSDAQSIEGGGPWANAREVVSGDCSVATGARRGWKGAEMGRLLKVTVAGLLVALLAAAVASCGSSTAEPTAEEYKALFTQWSNELDALPDSAVVGSIGIEGTGSGETATSDDSSFSQEEIGKTRQAVSQLEDLIKKVKAVKPPAQYAEVHETFLSLLRSMDDIASTAASMAEDGASASDIKEKLGDQVGTLTGMLLTYAGQAFAAGLVESNWEDSGVVESPSVEPEANDSQSGDGVGSRESAVPLGQGAPVGDWTVTVMSVTPDATQQLLDKDEFADPPQAGNQYVLVSVEATYDGTESSDFSMDVSWKFVGSKGNTFGSPEGFVTPPDPIWNAGEAFPGASVSGDLVFEVPSDQVTGGALMFEETFSFDDLRVFFAIH